LYAITSGDQFRLFANSVHTADADPTKLKNIKHVISKFSVAKVLSSRELCSHHRRQPDPIKQFCRVGVGGVKWVLVARSAMDVIVFKELPLVQYASVSLVQ